MIPIVNKKRKAQAHPGRKHDGKLRWQREQAFAVRGARVAIESLRVRSIGTSMVGIDPMDDTSRQVFADLLFPEIELSRRILERNQAQGLPCDRFVVNISSAIDLTGPADAGGTNHGGGNPGAFHRSPKVNGSPCAPLPEMSCINSCSHGTSACGPRCDGATPRAKSVVVVHHVARDVEIRPVADPEQHRDQPRRTAATRPLLRQTRMDSTVAANTAGQYALMNPMTTAATRPKVVSRLSEATRTPNRRRVEVCG